MFVVTIICIAIICVAWIVICMLANTYFKTLLKNKNEIIEITKKYTDICDRLEKDIKETKEIIKKLESFNIK